MTLVSRPASFSPPLSSPKADRLASRTAGVDYLGTFLAIAGLVLLTFALSEGPIAPDTWRTPCSSSSPLSSPSPLLLADQRSVIYFRHHCFPHPLGLLSPRLLRLGTIPRQVGSVRHPSSASPRDLLAREDRLGPYPRILGLGFFPTLASLRRP